MMNELACEMDSMTGGGMGGLYGNGSGLGDDSQSVAQTQADLAAKGFGLPVNTDGTTNDFSNSIQAVGGAVNNPSANPYSYYDTSFVGPPAPTKASSSLYTFYDTGFVGPPAPKASQYFVGPPSSLAPKAPGATGTTVFGQSVQAFSAGLTPIAQAEILLAARPTPPPYKGYKIGQVAVNKGATWTWSGTNWTLAAVPVPTPQGSPQAFPWWLVIAGAGVLAVVAFVAKGKGR